MTDDVRTSDVRILDEDPHNKNCECCQRLLQFLPRCCSFPQIEITSVCLCQGSLWVCLLFVCWWSSLFSIAPFLPGCCVWFFFQFFKLNIRSTYVPLSPSKELLTTYGPSESLCASRKQAHITRFKVLQDSCKASTCTSLFRGGSFQVLLADSWVAESAHSMLRRYYSLIVCLAWKCSSQGPQKTYCLFVWGAFFWGCCLCANPQLWRPSFCAL